MAGLSIDPNLYTTRPDSEGRLEKETRVYDMLEKLEIPYIRVDHEVTATIESCLEVEVMLEIEICKNLFLCNAQKTNFYLLMMPGNKKFRTADLSRQINTSRLSFAAPDYMEEFLNITPGSVSVLGLMNDKENRVQLLIDRDTFNQDSVGCHPCINTSSLKIKMADLLNKFLPYVKHEPIIVDL
ncbi:prolyl-tRNA synthetase associated domain-containing protein [Anaerocolumna sedimenticola]|uniref:Prolyl-tRNA synthetase associated domain-containing protein n=1 Tax=Anaerocolumna sedimenticola TaxID=2696063 RepID=A0A6P1TIC0_9FIRM|nr:prolyl-tRNA synthetase associated domain-containing protein [Anaerocolumna sedimenticola]QHQ59859.1 prolyl-tRNA synthetase associated domain-containing protein [Anaerocolumna sedimenticola]